MLTTTTVKLSFYAVREIVRTQVLNLGPVNPQTVNVI